MFSPWCKYCTTRTRRLPCGKIVSVHASTTQLRCSTLRRSALATSVATFNAQQVRKGLEARDFSAVELAQSALEFAQAENPKTNAYLTFCPERALAAAERVDKMIAGGEDPGPLAGVPVAVK